MTNNYQSIYTGEEIDRGIGFANNTLSLLYTIPVFGNFDNLMVGSQGSTSSSGFSRAPMVENVFSGIGRSSDNILFSFVGKITNAADPSIKFEFLQLNRITPRSPFLGMLSPIDNVTNKSFVKSLNTDSYVKFAWEWAHNAVYFVTVNERDENGGVITEGPVAGSGIIVTSSADQRLYIPCDADFGFLISLYADQEVGGAVVKSVLCEVRRYESFPSGAPISGFRVSFRRLV